MHTDVAGERRQEANTELMLFDPYEIVSYLSRRFTFQPGDVVAFGSPANPGLVEPDDTVEITYDASGRCEIQSPRVSEQRVLSARWFDQQARKKGTSARAPSPRS